MKYASNIEGLPHLLPDTKIFIIGGTEDDLSPLVAAFTPTVTAVLKPTGGSVRVIAQYSNGQVAAFLSSYGRGKIAASGPHPEARPT